MYKILAPKLFKFQTVESRLRIVSAGFYVFLGLFLSSREIMVSRTKLGRMKIIGMDVF